MTANTKALWKFDGRVVTDSSTNGNNGTLQGGATYSNDVPSGDGAGGGGGGIPAQTLWLVSDHLGTPRIIVDQTGSLAGVRRHDYLPFGEELFAGTGGRTVAMGYTSDGVRQQFTLEERDNETGLDYFGARYYASMQGRFTSPDPFGGSGLVSVPQSWNKYAYCLNRPFVFTDPSGMIWLTNDNTFFFWVDDAEYKKNKKQYEDYSEANGAVGQVQSCTDSSRCNGIKRGDWVQFNADGTMTVIADPTVSMTIHAQYDALVEDPQIYSLLGMTRTGGRKPSNPLFGPPGGKTRIDYEQGGYQERYYNENGWPWVDIDSGHDHTGAGDPHVHWWDPNKHPTHPDARGEPSPLPWGWDMWDNGDPIPKPRGSSPMVPVYPVPFGPMPARPMMPLRPVFLRPILVP
jgi:RHS repeat-associated protein